MKENYSDYRYRSNPICPRKLKCDRSVMTYSGHHVQQTLIRARFSPYESTASRFIYTGDNFGHVYSEFPSSVLFMEILLEKNHDQDTVHFVFSGLQMIKFYLLT